MAVKAKKAPAKKAAPKKKTPVKKDSAAKKAVVKVSVKKSAPKKAAVKASAKKAAPKKAAPKKEASQKSVKAKVAPKKASVKKALVKKSVKKAPLQKTVVKKVPDAPRGLPEILRDAALKVLDERQAENILTVNLQGKSAIADYAIIASGRSGRQLAAIADYLREAFFKAGVKQIRIEGLEQTDWVLVDAGDVLVHLFRPEVREYYQIEDIWSGSPRKR